MKTKHCEAILSSSHCKSMSHLSVLSHPCPSHFFHHIFFSFYIPLFCVYTSTPWDLKHYRTQFWGGRFSDPDSSHGQLVFVIRLRGCGEEVGWILRSDTSCHPVLVLQVSSASASPIFSWPPSAIFHPSHTLTLILSHTPLSPHYHPISHQPFLIYISSRLMSPNPALAPCPHRPVPLHSTPGVCIFTESQSSI